MKRWRLAAIAMLPCAVALAQPQPHAPPVPTEQGDDDDPLVTEDAGAFTWNVVSVVDASTPVVTGRGVQITAGELTARLRDASGSLQEGYATNPALLQELLDRMIADRLLADEARRRGFESDPLVRAAVERALVSRLRAMVINPAVDGTRPTDDEVRAWYDAHPERFHIPERRRARVIFLERRREAQEVLRLALLKRRRVFVHAFRHLAAERNDDPHLRSMAGDLRDITPTPIPGGVELDPAVRAAIFEVAHEDETLPRVVPGRWRDRPGFFVLHVVSRRRPEERSLAAQSDWIRLRIMMERRVNAERDRVAALARERGVTRVAIQQVLRFEQVAVTDAGNDADASR